MRKLAATVATMLSCVQAKAEGSDWYCSATFQGSTITMMNHYRVSGGNLSEVSSEKVAKVVGTYDLLITTNNEYGLVASWGYAHSHDANQTQLPLQVELIANSVLIDKKDGFFMAVAATSDDIHVEVRTGHCINGGP